MSILGCFKLYQFKYTYRSVSSEIDTIQFNFFLKKIPKFILHCEYNK